MRILILLRSSLLNRNGGAERQAHLIAKYFVGKGHDVRYVFESNEESKVRNFEAVKYFNIADYSRAFSFLNIFKIEQEIKLFRPDIIYQRCRSNYTFISAYLSRNYNLPFILHLSADDESQRNQLQVNSGLLSNLFNELLGRLGLPYSNKIICQNNYQQNKLQEEFNYTNSKIIDNLVCLERSDLKRFNNFTVSWVANFRDWKRPGKFIELAKRLEHTKIQFKMCGRSSPKYRKEMSRISLPNFEYLGELPFEEANTLISKSHLFINTSINKEGFPNTFIQSWFSGTPVLSLGVDPNNLMTTMKLGKVCKDSSEMSRMVLYYNKNKSALKKLSDSAIDYFSNSDRDNLSFSKLEEVIMEQVN